MLKIISIFFLIVICSGCSIHASIRSLLNESMDSTNSPEQLNPSEGTPQLIVNLNYNLNKTVFNTNENLTLIPTFDNYLSQFSITPDLPIGLSINANSGQITGNPSSPSTLQTYQIMALDSKNTQVSAQISFEVAATFNVNSTNDLNDISPGDGICLTLSGNCSLRAATDEANLQSSGVTSIINIPAGTYGLISQPLILNSRVILKGAGKNTTIIDANPDSTPISPALSISATSTYVVVDGLAIKNAALSAAPAGTFLGVAVSSLAKDAEFRNCEISNNTISGTNLSTVTGVGLYHNSIGKFTMDNCTITNNTASFPNPSSYSRGGGAYIESSDILLTNSNISNNTLTTTSTGSSQGGALSIGGGKSLIDNCAINGNTARNYAGGIHYRTNHPAEIKYSTLSENNASSLVFGTFIYAPNNGILSITNSTFYKATGAGSELIYADGTQLNIKNSTFLATINVPLIELNGATANIEASTLSSTYDVIYFRTNSGTLNIKSSILKSGNWNCTNHANPVVSYGYNVFSDNSCNAANGNDLVNTDPLLGAFADHGGATMTILPNTNSPARSLVPLAECLAKDQRDISRIINIFCDAGAVQN